MSFIRFDSWNFDKGGDTSYIYQKISVKKNLYKIQYALKSDSINSDTIKYILSTENSIIPTYQLVPNLSRKLDFYKDTVVHINNKAYKVFEYYKDIQVVDGGSQHYWTPKYGVFLVHSTTWPSIRISCSSDPKENQEILMLIKAVCANKKFFFRGKLLETINKIN
jgi:hypothetical protein